MYVENGVVIDASWTRHIAISKDGVSWDPISKVGLAPFGRLVDVKPNEVTYKNQNPQTWITLKGADNTERARINLQEVDNQPTWTPATQAGLDAAIADITGWLG